MKKNAFTLIELIGIITILALVVVISVPAVNSIIESNKNKEYENFVDNLKIAAESYISKNYEKFDSLHGDLGEIYISIYELQKNGYLTSNISNPRTSETFENLMYKTIRVYKTSKGTLEYEYTNEENSINSYINDNLFLQLDGIYNDGMYKNYNQSTRNFKNLTEQNINPPIYGASFNDNYLAFDGADDYMDFSGDLNNLYKSANTIEFLVYFNKSDERDLLIGNYNKNNNINIERYTGNSIRFYFNSGAVDYKTNNNVVSGNEVMLIDVVFDKPNTNVAIYKDGNLIGNVSDSKFANNYDFKDVKFGVDNRTDKGVIPLNGRLYALRVYTKALSIDEIKHNYNVDKNRYGF